MMRASSWIGAAAGVLLLTVSCDRTSPARVANGDDPIAALAASHRSAVYDAAFWAREFHRQTATWRRAAAFCRGRADAPNCHPVRLAELWEAPPFEEAIRLPRPAQPPASPPPVSLPAEDKR